MDSAIAGNPMARDDVVVKVDREVIRKAKMIARYYGKHLAEFLSEELHPIVDAKYPRIARLMLEEDEKERAAKAKKKGKKT
jgi:flagellar motor switch protein FliM